MTKPLRHLLLATTICALPFAAQAQSDSRYGSWSPPGSQAADSQSNSALLKELETLINQAERDRAANPVFIRDLKDLVARHENPWSVRVLSDDFADGDFVRNPGWTVTSGEYYVEQGYGLRSRPTAQAPATTQNRKMSEEEVVISILGAVLQGANKNGGTKQTTPVPTKAKAATISTRGNISNAFAVSTQITSWTASGTFELAVNQGSGNAGYRVAYSPGANGGQGTVELVRETSRGRGVIDSAQIPTLEDQKPHTMRWTRGRDGTMGLSVDGKRILNARDTSFRDPFNALAITNTGTDIIVQNVDVLGAR